MVIGRVFEDSFFRLHVEKNEFLNLIPAKTIIPTKLGLFEKLVEVVFYNFVAGHILLNPKTNKLQRKNVRNLMKIQLYMIFKLVGQDQDSLLVKRRNDNHSAGPVIRELVPSSHQRSELSNTILCIFSR